MRGERVIDAKNEGVTPNGFPQCGERAVEVAKHPPISAELALTSCDQIRYVTFAAQPERGRNGRERDEPLMPSDPCHEAPKR
jgi:hypothetical protein